MIAVSKKVLEDYEAFYKEDDRSFVLPNFISDKFFIKKNREKDFSSVNEIKMVAVGNIKNQKNYCFLLKAFENLEEYPISLDIYGQGNAEELKKIQTEIDQKKLPVVLKGQANNVE